MVTFENLENFKKISHTQQRTTQHVQQIFRIPTKTTGPLQELQ